MKPLLTLSCAALVATLSFGVCFAHSGAMNGNSSPKKVNAVSKKNSSSKKKGVSTAGQNTGAKADKLPSSGGAAGAVAGKPLSGVEGESTPSKHK